MTSLTEWVMSVIVFIVAVAAYLVIISIFLGTIRWIADDKPRDPWWVHFLEIWRMQIDD